MNNGRWRFKTALKKYHFFIPVIYILIVVVRCITAYPLDDEINRVFVDDQLRTLGWMDKLSLWGFEAQPPLSLYFYFAIYSLFGKQLLWYRLFSILPVVFIIPVFNYFIREFCAPKNRLTCWLLFTLYPVCIMWFPFAKYYCWLTFFTMLFFMLLDKIARKSDRTLFTLSALTLNIALISYVHYIMTVLWGTALVVFLFYRKNRRLFVSLMISFILMLPNIVIATAKSPTMVSFNLKATLINFAILPFSLAAGETIYPWRWWISISTSISLAVLFVVLVRLARYRQTELRLPLIVFIATTAGIQFLESIQSGDGTGGGLTVRYLTLTGPLFVVLLVCSISGIRSPLMRGSALAFFTAVFLYSDYNLFTLNDYWKAGLTDDWDRVVTEIKNRGRDSRRSLVVNRIATLQYLCEQDESVDSYYLEAYFHAVPEKNASRVKLLAADKDRLFYVRMVNQPYAEGEAVFINTLEKAISGDFKMVEVLKFFRDEHWKQKAYYSGRDYKEWRVEVYIFERTNKE